jgi:hypothetical protein
MPYQEPWGKTEKGLLHSPTNALGRGTESTQPTFNHLWGMDISYVLLSVEFFLIQCKGRVYVFNV